MHIKQLTTALYFLLAIALAYLWFALDSQRSRHIQALLDSEVESRLGEATIYV